MMLMTWAPRMKKSTSDLISKNTVPRLANKLAKKMLINNRIVLLSLFRTSFLLLALLVGLLLLVMRETPADFLSCLCGSERIRTRLSVVSLFLSCLCGSERPHFVVVTIDSN